MYPKAIQYFIAFNNLIGPSLTVPTLPSYSNIFSIYFSSPHVDFPLVTVLCVLTLLQNTLSLTILSEEVTERKGPFLSITVGFYDFKTFLIHAPAF